MRDLLILFFLLGSVPLILMRPYIGIVMWFVVSFMNPHQMAYGFISTMPVALLIGGATVLGFVLSREPKHMPFDTTIALIIALMVWITITTISSIVPDLAWADWNRSIKMFAVTLLVLPLINNRQRLHGIIWAIVISVDFYGVRGGLFTIVTGGGGSVTGPPQTMLSDNNQLATALIMTLPLIRYLQTQSENRYVRIGLLVTMGLTIVSVFGSFSRGALIGIAVMFLWLLRSSRHKTTIVIAAVFGVSALSAVMPASWYARMNTIQSYQEDGSATGRLDAWKFAYRLALERPLVGGGFHVYADGGRFMALVPEAQTPRAFHSIYFEAMGEHGFVGLGLFLAIIVTGFISTMRLRKRTRRQPDQVWAYELASMIQVSIVGYIVAGAFLELTFLDLFYAIVIVPTLLEAVLAREEAADKQSVHDIKRTSPVRFSRRSAARPFR